VQPGTHAGLVAKTRKPVADKPLRAWDRLAALPVMQRREPLRMVTGPPSSTLEQLGELSVTSEQEK
jgi:hypothetical protein